MGPDLATRYLRWAFLTAASARGWWLATALYLVVEARLEPFQLVLIGTFQGLVVVLTEVPAGVLADSVSRRTSLVIAHVVRGAGMVLAGFVTSFPMLVLANGLWGMGWAFASGADVAWITDELDERGESGRTDRVLGAQGRWDLLGNPAGVAAAGALAWATSLATAMVAAGTVMVVLGGLVARWPERGFAPVAAERSLSASTAILRRGLSLARRDRVVLAVLASTVLLNGSHEGYGRLRERRLVRLGMPEAPDPIVWFALLGLAAVAVAVVALHAVERRIDTPDVARRAYVASCVLAAIALVGFALAPTVELAVVASLLATGMGATQRITATIRVNRRTSSDVRATVHSLLSWSENLGEIVFGLLLAIVAATTTATVAILGSAVLLVAAAAAGAVDER